VTIAWPPPVVQAIARRRAVLLIGSGISANAKTDAGDHPPTWGQFLVNSYESLNRRLPYIKRAIDHYNYLEACDYLKTEYDAEWPDLIRRYFIEPQYKPADIHKAIFDLDSRIVMSLNFDKIYDNYAISAAENTIVVKHYYDEDVRQAVAGVDRYIIKPHGTIDSVSKLIFTLHDYAKARVKYAQFYELITALLHTHVFLCVGCGLSDPDIKLIFEDYRYKFSESPHYITLPNPITAAEVALIQKTRGLNVIKYSPKDGHADLTTSLFELGNLVNTKRDEIAGVQSW
jgi:hypothetical protein